VGDAIKPHGSLRIEVESDGIPAGVDMFFVFDGDWANVYDDVIDTEQEAYALFVEEIRQVLEGYREESRGGAPA
jgi:hypothetical protein